MRFISNGPDIPNQLLKQRDLGSVVFLCGAGVSIPSGLPSFEALTRNIIDSLSPSNDSQVYKAFSTWNEKNIPEKQYSRVPLDQVFHLLQKDLKNAAKGIWSKARQRSFTDLRQRHTADHGALFNRVHIDLRGTQAELHIPTTSASSALRGIHLPCSMSSSTSFPVT